MPNVALYIGVSTRSIYVSTMYHRGHEGVSALASNVIVSVAVSKLARMIVAICVLSDRYRC